MRYLHRLGIDVIAIRMCGYYLSCIIIHDNREVKYVIFVFSISLFVVPNSMLYFEFTMNLVFGFFARVLVHDDL